MSTNVSASLKNLTSVVSIVYIFTYLFPSDLTGKVLILLNFGFLTSFYVNFSLVTKYSANFCIEMNVSLIIYKGSFDKMNT